MHPGPQGSEKGSYKVLPIHRKKKDERRCLQRESGNGLSENASEEKLRAIRRAKKIDSFGREDLFIEQTNTIETTACFI